MTRSQDSLLDPRFPAAPWIATWVLTAVAVLQLASGQGNSGKILGVVTDASGAVVPGARLVAISSTLPGALNTTSGDDGRFVFETVPIGVYEVTVAKAGFTTVRQLDLRVNLGAQVDFNPRLEVGPVTEILDVPDAAVSLDIASSRVATNITAAQFNELPKGRTFNSLLQM